MASPELKVLRDVVEQAVRLGADSIEVEYKDGFEEVFAMRGGMGVGISRFASGGPEAKALRRELQATTRKKQRVVIDNAQYDLRVGTYESFGEYAFRVAVRRI